MTKAKTGDKKTKKMLRRERVLPGGYIEFIGLFGRIVCIAPVIVMGFMYGITIGFLEAARKTVTLYESLLAPVARPRRKGGSTKEAS
jgi:hypothetical protein